MGYSLFVLYSRHTTSSLHGDTRRLILFTWQHTPTDPTHGPIPTNGVDCFASVAATHALPRDTRLILVTGDTRQLIRHTGSCSFLPIRHTDPSQLTGNSFLLSSATHAGIHLYRAPSPPSLFVIQSDTRIVFFFTETHSNRRHTSNKFFTSSSIRPTDPSSLAS